MIIKKKFEQQISILEWFDTEDWSNDTKNSALHQE